MYRYGKVAAYLLVVLLIMFSNISSYFPVHVVNSVPSNYGQVSQLKQKSYKGAVAQPSPNFKIKVRFKGSESPDLNFEAPPTCDFTPVCLNLAKASFYKSCAACHQPFSFKLRGPPVPAVC